MRAMSKEEYRKRLKNFNAGIERRFRKANKGLIEKNDGEILGCMSHQIDGASSLTKEIR